MHEHPLPIGTRVAVDIAEGHAVGESVICAAEFNAGNCDDEFWVYRLDIPRGTKFDAHRNDAGELWACDFEVTPLPAHAEKEE